MMNISVGKPEIGQWYSRADKGEWFLMVARDDESRTIEIQSFDGEVDEIDAETWNTLPLERASHQSQVIRCLPGWCSRSNARGFDTRPPGNSVLHDVAHIMLQGKM